MHIHPGRASFLSHHCLPQRARRGEKEREGERAPDYSPVLFHPRLMTGDSANIPLPHPHFHPPISPIQPSEKWASTFSHIAPGASEGYDYLSLAMWSFVSILHNVKLLPKYLIQQFHLDERNHRFQEEANYAAFTITLGSRM